MLSWEGNSWNLGLSSALPCERPPMSSPLLSSSLRGPQHPVIACSKPTVGVILFLPLYLEDLSYFLCWHLLIVRHGEVHTDILSQVYVSCTLTVFTLFYSVLLLFLPSCFSFSQIIWFLISWNPPLYGYIISIQMIAYNWGSTYKRKHAIFVSPSLRKWSNQRNKGYIPFSFPPVFLFPRNTRRILPLPQSWFITHFRFPMIEKRQLPWHQIDMHLDCGSAFYQWWDLVENTFLLRF